MFLWIFQNFFRYVKFFKYSKPIAKQKNEKKSRKNKQINSNQSSFYFEDYLETNKKNKNSKINSILQDRIYLLFFLFFSLIFIFSVRIIHVSLNKIEILNNDNEQNRFSLLRRDIIDRNGNLISRNINPSMLL